MFKDSLIPIKSPFERWSQPTPGQILDSLDNKTVVIFADGSTKPEPGIGGAGLVIQDPSLEQWIEMEFPIKGITTTIGSEIDAIRNAIEYVITNYRARDERVVILSDCKFAVNAIHNKINSENYNLPIAELQRLLNDLGDVDVPEIYWIKGHSGIPGKK